MKKKKRFRQKSGFTLVELVVTIAVLSIVAGMGVGIIGSAIKNYSTASVTSKEQDTALLIEKYLVDGLSKGSLISDLDSTDENTTSTSAKYLYFENDQLVCVTATVEKTGDTPSLVKMYYSGVRYVSVTVKKSKPSTDKEIDPKCFIHCSYKIEMNAGYTISGARVMINADDKYVMDQSNNDNYSNVNKTKWISDDDTLTEEDIISFIKDPAAPGQKEAGVLKINVA